MDISIALVTIAKLALFLGTIPFLALFILFPINDKPTSRTQFLVFILVELLIIDVLFTHFINVSVSIST